MRTFRDAGDLATWRDYSTRRDNMKTKLFSIMLALLAVLAVGCGDSNDDVAVVNPGTPGTGGGGSTTTFVRLAHLVPGGANYDIYVNNQLTLNNLTYGQFTDYLALPTNARIRVTVSGNQNVTLLNRTLASQASTYQTLTLTGVPSDIVSNLYTDDVTPDQGVATVRLVNASSGNNSVSLTEDDGSLVVGSVDFPNATNYVQVTPAVYDLQVRDLQDMVLLELPDVEFVAGTNYSVYVAGQDSSNTLGVVVAVDSTTQGVNNGVVVTQ